MNFLRKLQAVSIFLLFGLFFSCSKSNFQFFVAGSEFSQGKKIDLVAKTRLFCGGYYKFDENLRRALENFVQRTGESAIELQISVPKIKEKQTLDDSFGFLYDFDFEKNGKLKKSLESRATITANFSDFAGMVFRIAFCLKKDGKIPRGFYVSSNFPCKILGAKITKGVCGFDRSAEEPFFAFSPNGGKITLLEKCEFDFSGLSEVFPTRNSQNTLLPSMQISFSENAAPDSTVTVNLGGERLKIQIDEKREEIFPLSLFSSPFSFFFASENPQNLASCLVFSTPSKFEDQLVPLSCEPGLILAAKMQNWRSKDFEIFSWDRFPKILFFDTANYAVQDNFFRRLAFFAEKKSFKGRLLRDSELQNLHGYNAHDYSAQTLANFFEKAERDFFPLNDYELKLKEILLKSKIITRGDDGTIQAGEGAVISISQESSAELRRVFVAHEGWHGLYFTDEDFRNTVAAIYYTMEDSRAINFLKAYFSVTPTLNYDTNDEELMKNEFMAYMLQRPVSQCENYFVNMASRSHAQSKIKLEADYIIASRAASLVSAADLLDQYVAARWNFNAGKVWRIERN